MKILEAIIRKDEREHIERIEAEENKIIKLIRENPEIGQKEIMTKTGMSRTTYQNRLRSLKARGIIKSRRIYELVNDAKCSNESNVSTDKDINT